MLVLMIHHTVSLVKMLVTTASTSAATATSVAHCRVVLGSHLAVAVTGTHHREDLGETLTILGQTIINKNLVRYYLPWQSFPMVL